MPVFHVARSIIGAVTETTYTGPPPRTNDELAMDLADRLNKSLRLSGISVQEMAQYLEVHRSTISTWLSGKNKPSPATLRLWAMRTNVPYQWLRDEPDSKPEAASNSRS